MMTLAGHTQPVKTVVWPHEGDMFTAGYDHCIKVWDLESKTTTSTMVSYSLIHTIMMSIIFTARE